MVITTTIVSLLILGLLPFVVSSTTWATRSDPIHVPLTRRSHKSRGLEDLAKAANNLRTKYNFQTIGSERKRGTTAAEPIINLVGSLKFTLSALNGMLWISKETRVMLEL
jgi:cathepsin D